MTYNKLVIWTCDKASCEQVNRREIKSNFIINDDVCDRCHKPIHEPLVSEIIIDKKNEQRRKK
jgi:hypothetical protein